MVEGNPMQHTSPRADRSFTQYSRKSSQGPQVFVKNPSTNHLSKELDVMGISHRSSKKRLENVPSDFQRKGSHKQSDMSPSDGGRSMVLLPDSLNMGSVMREDNKVFLNQDSKLTLDSTGKRNMQQEL